MWTLWQLIIPSCASSFLVFFFPALSSALSPVHPLRIQSSIMFLGVSSGLLVCVAGVQRGDLTVGDTVLYMALMAQLYQPLAFFGSNYRLVMSTSV